MNPELGLWFRFLRAFNIQDPYCFTYDGIEFSENAFQNLKTEGSALAPNFDFSKENYIFNVRKIRPLYDFLLKNHSKSLADFFKENKINREIFYILNHPLTTEFVDTFFTFLDENKINSKSLSLMDLSFNAAFGRQKDNLGAMDFKNLFNLINDESDNILDYEISDKNGEYFINLKKKSLSLMKSLKKSDFIMNYDMLYPYYALKSTNSLKSATPQITEIKKDQRWQVLYA